MSKIRLIMTSIISILLVSILFLGSTYSIFTSQDIDEELNVYKTGDLNIKYYSNNVKFTDITPMTIEEADAVIPHRLTVTNNGNVTYQFDVILSDTTSSETNTIDYQYIMTKVGYLEPKKLSSCTNNIIKEDIILLPGESVYIDVRVWLSDNISNSEIGKSFYAKLSIDGQAIINENKDINNDILSLKYMNSTPYRDDKYRTYIKQASFIDYINTTNASVDSETNEQIIWDVSSSKDESIIAWLEDNGELDENGNKYYNLYVGSKYKIYVQSLRVFFSNMTSLEGISFDNFSTSLTTLMGLYPSNGVFYNCSSLISLDLSNWNTSNVTEMSGLFGWCSNLTSLDLSSFDTGKVTTMVGMFTGCSSLTELDVSSFDTSNVTLMANGEHGHGMFFNCSSLTELDLSSFDTSNVTNMAYMFNLCENLISLDLSNFNTEKVTNMNRIFESCYSLTSLDLSNFDTSNVTNMRLMFNWCSSLEELDISSFDTSNVTNMDGMFGECSSLVSLDLSNFNTSKVTNIGGMFYNCKKLTSLDVSSFDVSNVTNVVRSGYMGVFDGCSSLISLDLNNWYLNKITDIRNMFRGCTSLTELDLSNFNTSKVTNMSDMFNGCSSLKSLNINNFDTSEVTSMNRMFYFCKKITTTITIKNVNTTDYSVMVTEAATEEGASITINYIPDDPATTDVNESTEAIVDAMIATKSSGSNIVKGCYGDNCPIVT